MHAQDLPHIDERRYPEYISWACSTILVAWENSQYEKYRRWAKHSIIRRLEGDARSLNFCDPDSVWEDIFHDVLAKFLEDGKRLPDIEEFRACVKYRTIDFLRGRKALCKGFKRKVSFKASPFAVDLASTADIPSPTFIEIKTTAKQIEEPWRTKSGQPVWLVTLNGELKRGRWTWQADGLHGNLNELLLAIIEKTGPEAWEHLHFQVLNHFRDRRRLRLRKSTDAGEGKRRHITVNEAVYHSRRASRRKDPGVPHYATMLEELYSQYRYSRIRVWRDDSALTEGMRRCSEREERVRNHLHRQELRGDKRHIAWHGPSLGSEADDFVEEKPGRSSKASRVSKRSRVVLDIDAVYYSEAEFPWQPAIELPSPRIPPAPSLKNDPFSADLKCDRKTGLLVEPVDRSPKPKKWFLPAEENRFPKNSRAEVHTRLRRLYSGRLDSLPLCSG